MRDADSPTHKAPPESAQPVSSSPTDAVPLSGGATFLEELQVAAADPGCIAPPLTVRCSSLPLLETCAGAAFGGVYIDSDSGAARVGTAVHSVAAAIVRGGRVSILSEDRAHEVQTACDEAGTTEVEEVRRLSAAVARAWRALAHGYPSPKVETSMRADLPGVDTALTGTADLVSIGTGGRGAHVLDWKTGRLQGGHMAQLKGYAWLTLQTHPELLSVTARVVWVRFGRTSRLYAWSRSELDEWAACLGRHLGKWDGRFRHGGHCAHCTRAAACPARAALVRADVAALAGDDMAKLIEEGLRDLAPDQVLDLRARAKQVKGLATAVLSAISDLVRRHGPVRGEASTLEAHAEKRNSVDVRKAWAILRRRFDDETLSGVLKVANGKLSTAARSAADKGQKAKAAAALWRELEEAGAVYTTTIRKVREVRNDG